MNGFGEASNVINEGSHNIAQPKDVRSETSDSVSVRSFSGAIRIH
jgi:hypothetical protein